MEYHRGSAITESQGEPGVSDILLAFGILVILLPAIAVWITLQFDL
jgi:hypothetical protein